MKAEFEVSYLLKLKIELEKQIYHLINFANFRRPKGDYTDTFIEFFDSVIEKTEPIKLSQEFTNDMILSEFNEKNKFDFDYFTKELLVLSSNQEKIDLIKQRLIDHEQWQIINNLVDNDSFWGSVNPGRSEFAKLCKSEMKRYPVEKEEVKRRLIGESRWGRKVSWRKKNEQEDLLEKEEEQEDLLEKEERARRPVGEGERRRKLAGF